MPVTRTVTLTSARGNRVPLTGSTAELRSQLTLSRMFLRSGIDPLTVGGLNATTVIRPEAVSQAVITEIEHHLAALPPAECENCGEDEDDCACGHCDECGRTVWLDDLSTFGVAAEHLCRSCVAENAARFR